LAYHGIQQQLEHNFVVSPGASRKIEFEVNGRAKIRKGKNGDLVLQLN